MSVTSAVASRARAGAVIQRTPCSAGPEARELRLPVGEHAGRADDERRPLERAERLQRLAEAHVVGEHAAEAGAAQEGEPVDALALVGAQRRREIARAAAPPGAARSPRRAAPAARGPAGGGCSSSSHSAASAGSAWPRQAAVVLARGQQIGDALAVLLEPADGSGAQPPPSSGTRPSPSCQARTTAAASTDPPGVLPAAAPRAPALRTSARSAPTPVPARPR